MADFDKQPVRTTETPSSIDSLSTTTQDIPETPEESLLNNRHP